ncbi:hypothetical protein IU510_09510 [Nocardia cyriacigeorgica]|uniref:restriction endonuclease subunit S n=1 Tax=Nocardia cyriacigeorgica TaxID=135487 RepID=UPI001893104B|nr:hypothetical protein [Nocardia cyriacigeorgica]MBF6098312.1 hypothetical protein [Nocardia cyriacigeorgica]MBF6318127.1 hypothetical protein [Nocardia cyriacigeorgica]MBF6516769.1 hypothetical protein [Nocardia cyriacigeorgica]MBF6532907.1 hypothetical protein [Nocardia cyriacigeorgica]
MELLSVYRDYGVVPKSSRDDNFNKPSEDLSSYRYVRPGDLVLNKMKTWQGSLGISLHEGIVSPAYFVCEVSPDLHSRYAHYLLRSAPYIHLYRSVSKGIRPNQWDLPYDEMVSLPALVPPLEEQRRIADFLDAETSRIGRIAESRRRQMDTLVERSYAVGSETLLPGILSAPTGEGPWPWLPDLPDDRPLVRLGYVCRIQNGVTVDGKRRPAPDWVTRPYLRVANVQAGYVDLGSVTEIAVPPGIAARSTLRPGDVLMTEGGDLDKLGRGTVWKGEIDGCLHQNHVFALRPERDRLDGDYLALMTQTLHGRCYFESTGVKTTNLASTNSSKILGFPIPMPSLAEQRNLAAEVACEHSVIRRTARALERQLDLLSERRQSLITAAVTGQFDVSTASGRNTIQGV